MREMLASQYFITRKYDMAALELEKAMSDNPASKSIKKKIIICYIQTKQIKKAFDIFNGLVKDDPFFIVNTDIVADYCPCPDLIYEYENALDVSEDHTHRLILAMLWLYCDVDESIKYFELLKKNSQQMGSIHETLSRLNKIKQELKPENNYGKQES